MDYSLEDYNGDLDAMMKDVYNRGRYDGWHDGIDKAIDLAYDYDHYEPGYIYALNELQSKPEF